VNFFWEALTDRKPKSTFELQKCNKNSNQDGLSQTICWTFKLRLYSTDDSSFKGGAEVRRRGRKNPQAESDCDELSCKQTFIVSS